MQAPGEQDSSIRDGSLRPECDDLFPWLNETPEVCVALLIRRGHQIGMVLAVASARSSAGNRRTTVLTDHRDRSEADIGHSR
jgi:hypothetical protein